MDSQVLQANSITSPLKKTNQEPVGSTLPAWKVRLRHESAASR